MHVNDCTKIQIYLYRTMEMFHCMFCTLSQRHYPILIQRFFGLGFVKYRHRNGTETEETSGEFNPRS